MSARMRIASLTLLTVALDLSACGSAPRWQPSEPYWEQEFYQRDLLREVQSVVHTSSDDTPIPAGGIHGTVRFTVTGERIEYPEMVVSTGDHDLDKLMLQQVTSAQLRKPEGPHADEPHEFELRLDMPTPLESFEYGIYDAIDRWKVYPENAVIAGDMGVVAVDFDYSGGKASNPVVVKSDRSQLLNKASLEAVTKAALPAPLPPYVGKTLHMEAVFCYSLNDAIKCPEAGNVISVLGTRIRRY